MNIWLARHGQTNLNKDNLMQGRTDEPLNETGIAQAQARRREIEAAYPGLTFDAVYASPLRRAIVTGSILGNIPEEDIIIDPRVIETDFGKYEKKNYRTMGLRMSSYWLLPEFIPAPESVESVDEMIARAHGFLKELEQMDYENVLVACHGGILRVLRGYMEDRPRGFRWRPKPKNCEVDVYESLRGAHRTIRVFR